MPTPGSAERLRATITSPPARQARHTIIASLRPRELLAFQPSASARQRVWELLERQKTASLPAEERAELDHYLEMEHLMRLAKARARQLLTPEHGG